MKTPKRNKALRSILMSALILAALSCMSVFLAVNAAEDTEQPENVSVSDVADEAEETPSEEAVEESTIEVTYDEVVDCKNHLFKPNAQYNGSFRSELLDSELPVYDALYDSMVTNKSNSPVELDTTDLGYTESTVGDIVLSAYAAFSTDHPEVYWISGYGLSYTAYKSGEVTSLKITTNERYSGDYSQLSTVESGIAAAYNAINASRESTSRYDTAKAIHDYICNTMEYDYGAVTTNYGEAHCAAPLFGGGRRGHKFVCEGYANAFKLLCDKFGVPAVHVKGTAVTGGQSGGHSWNYVKLDDNCWYGVDSTWNDGNPVEYTYFAIGSNTFVSGGKTFAEDHIPEDQVMTSNTVYPLVYPPLSEEAYTPGENFDFYGASGADNREICGSAEYVWKYRGGMSAGASVYVSVNGTQIATLSMDDDGFFRYTLDVSGMANGSYTIQAVLHRLGGDDITVSKTFIVMNPDFDFYNWPASDPVISSVYSAQMRQVYGGSSIQCQADIYIDGSFVRTLYCDNNGFFSYDIDPAQFADGAHTIKAVFSNTSGVQIERTKSFTVANPAFEILNKQDSPEVSGTFNIQMKQYNCGGTSDCHVDFYIDEVMTATLNCDANGIFSYAVDTTQLANGSHTLRAVLVTDSGTQLSDSQTFITNNTIPALSLSLDLDSAELAAGQSLKLTASVYPANTTDEIEWTTSDPSIASVKPNGIVTAVGTGEAIITATAGSVSDSCIVTVTAPPVAYPVKINKSALKLVITDNVKAPSATLSAQKPKYIKSVVWYSDDPEVATVDSKGKVTGHKNGTANIYCKFANGETVSEPCVVYVNLFTIHTANLTSLPSCSYINGVYWINYLDTASLNIVESDLSPDAPSDPVIWKSSSAVVTVDANGWLSGTGRKGTVTVTASKGKTLKTSIKVRAYQPTETLALNNYAPSLYVKKSVSLKAYLSKGSDEPVFWSSSNEAVATVGSNGAVKGISQGEATVTAYTKSGLTQTSNVTVRTPATALAWDTLHPGMNARSTVKYAIGVGASKELFAKITAPVNCNDTLTWTTSNKLVVAIDEVLSNGSGVRVVGLKKGAATITAKAGSGKKITYQIVVVPDGAQQIQLTKKNVSLYCGASLQLSAKLLPKGCNDVIIWNSADTSIATVDENGRVTAVAQGDTTITAYSTVTGVEEVASVHVMTKATGLTWDEIPEGLTPRSAIKIALRQNYYTEIGVRITAPENCNDVVTWTNSNPKAFFMEPSEGSDKYVTVLAFGSGTATITAKTGSGKKIAYQFVSVPQPAEALALNRHQVSVYEGATCQLSTTVFPKGCKDVVMWYSSDPAIASVDENGRITAFAQGDVRMIAYSTLSGVSDSVDVHVMSKATGLTWDTVPEGMKPRGTVKYAIRPGEEMDLNVAITAPQDCNDTVSWTNSNKKAVDMQIFQSNDKTVTVSGLAKGTATITARTGSGKKVTYQITVVPVSAESIVLNKHEATLYKGALLQLAAKITPKGCNDVVMWRSADPEIATVDEGGRITAVANGQTEIIAYSAISGAISDTISVRVITKATAIDVDFTDIYFGVGEAFTMAATVTDEDCNDTVTWTSSSKAVATVTPSGDGRTATITALKLGNCTVKVKTGSGKYRNINVSVYK